MSTAEEDLLHCRLQLEANTEYFLYIGELKSDCLNQFLQEALSRKYGKKFSFISIIPDVLSCYPDKNLLVLNPESRKLSAGKGHRVNSRTSARTFASQVSNSSRIQALVQDLLQSQGRLFLHVYESVPELTLANLPGVTLLGPDPEIASLWNNKLHQLQTLQQTTAPVIDFRICTSRKELLQTTAGLWPKWQQGLFISQPYSAAGMNSFLAYSQRELEKIQLPADSSFLVSRYIPHQADPTVLGVVAGPDQVFIAMVADQDIQEGNKFKGSSFPSALSAEIQQELQEQSREVGSCLGQSGYKGIFGCDFIVDDQGKLHFVEVNARKQGTTMEMCCTLENLLPAGAPNLLELELYAVTQGRLPKGTQELQEAAPALCWRTYNYKTESRIWLQENLRQEQDERELFRQVARGQQEQGLLILEHPGAGVQAEPGTFVGRVVAVSSRKGFLEPAIKRGRQSIANSIQTLEGQEP
ncbi:MAG: ATP-grasp domain-containing protein [Desulfohalobiaceae bacterium]